ncbi:MAG: cyclase family protein [Crocinitomicaceae bacterium]|nr:cyclase family protein [Crocinitomicaceae bacterium]
MKLTLENGKQIDTSKYYDISMTLSSSDDNVLAWYCDPPKITPVMTDQFTGDVNLGGNVNFRDVVFNPHGNGTHTECLGHISKEFYSVNKLFKDFFVQAHVITVNPEVKRNNEYDCDDLVITKELLEKALPKKRAECIIIRTLPNTEEKLKKNYSDTNPPFIEVDAISLFNSLGVNHLMIDLPSVDRELDNGELAFHHAFWQYPENPQLHKTITELVYINDLIEDGEYFANIQIASFENDASPSKILLFPYE